jgi:hypothetical protein
MTYPDSRGPPAPPAEFQHGEYGTRFGGSQAAKAGNILQGRYTGGLVKDIEEFSGKGKDILTLDTGVENYRQKLLVRQGLRSVLNQPFPGTLVLGNAGKAGAGAIVPESQFPGSPGFM